MSSSRPISRRRGHTLIELVVAMTSATVLLAGLGGAVVVTSRAFRPETAARYSRTSAAMSGRDLLGDLRLATGFTERTDKAAKFTVPDRDGDGKSETLRYAWSGVSGDPLTFSYNGAAAYPVAADVRAFSLAYVTRLTAAVDLPPEIMRFGYESVFSNAVGSANAQFAARATLVDKARVQSVTAYVGGASGQVRYAIYADNNGEPGALLAQSAVGATSSTMSWVALALPSTDITAGTYWLSLSFDSSSQRFRRDDSYSGAATRTKNHPAATSGFISTWGSSNSSDSDSAGSIYVTYEVLP